MRLFFLKQVLFLFFVFVVLGCGGSKPSRYYLLTVQEDTQPPPTALKNTKIGLGPVQFPEYLLRPKIVSYSGNNQLNLAEYERWAEPLDDNFSRVLAEYLTVLIPSDQIYIYPYVGNIFPEYQVMLEIRQFEMNNNSEVELIAHWQIWQEEDSQLLIVKRSQFREKVDASSYDSIVTGMSKVTADLSKEIVQAIQNLLNN